MRYSRRAFGKLALAGFPATALSLKSSETFAAAKPNSKWAGVQVGMNVPYNFGTGNYTSGDEILDRCVKLGISGVELRAQPVELFLGSPAAIAGAAAQAARAGGAAPAGQGGGRGGGRGAATPEQQAAQKAAAEETRKWRQGVSMSKVKDFR